MSVYMYLKINALGDYKKKYDPFARLLALKRGVGVCSVVGVVSGFYGSTYSRAYIIHTTSAYTFYTNLSSFYRTTILLDACTITTSSLGANLGCKVGDPVYSHTLVFTLPLVFHPLLFFALVFSFASCFL